MNKEFVPYEQALALKELGFDEPCYDAYTYEGGGESTVPPERYNHREDVIAAPLYQQVFRWFRQKGYDIKVQKESKGSYFGFYWTGASWVTVGAGSYEEAELACLIKLIELCQNKKK